MSIQIEETLAALSIGDYFLGTDGEVVWKVVKKREDGYLGIANAAGEKVIVKPEYADRRVQQVIYGVDSLEELQARAEANVTEILGGVVLGTQEREGSPFVMPSWSALEADEKQLWAHLVFAHGEHTNGDTLAAHHRSLHDAVADHTHPEKD